MVVNRSLVLMLAWTLLVVMVVSSRLLRMGSSCLKK